MFKSFMSAGKLLFSDGGEVDLKTRPGKEWYVSIDWWLEIYQLPSRTIDEAMPKTSKTTELSSYNDLIQLFAPFGQARSVISLIPPLKRKSPIVSGRFLRGENVRKYASEDDILAVVQIENDNKRVFSISYGEKQMSW